MMVLGMHMHVYTMEALSSSSYYGLCIFLALLVHVVLRVVFGSGEKQRRRVKLPPGPWNLPVIGSLHHLLRGYPHRTIRDLSRRYGPLMLLRICEREVVVVSTAEAAREICKDHDVAFAQRPSSPGIEELYRHGEGVIFSPYGDYWRLMRRILMTELLSARRVESFRAIREEEAARLVSSLLASQSPAPSGPGGGGGLVNMSERMSEFMADAAVRAIFGDRLPDRAAFLKMVKHGTDLSSLFDLRDLFPSSRLVRLLSRSRGGGAAERHRREMFRLMDEILETHDKRRAAGDGNDDDQMIDVLFRVQKEGNMRATLTTGVIRAALTEVFGAALDTSSTTLDWAMVELIANPKVMQKAQSEIRRVLKGKFRVDETTLSELHYLKAVIKETLRLHPPAVLNPRLCMQDIHIQGYDVPQGMIIMTNIWAISRDPKYWKEPETFMPERFETDCALDFRGMDFEFTPFGCGRRICPGMNFAHANVEIALASLLYHFDWELPVGVKPEQLDMTEAMGVTLARKAELFLRPIPCIPLLEH